MGRIKKKGLCLVYTTTVCAIWHERNARAHGGTERAATQIAKETIHTIINTIKCIAKEND